VNDPSMTWIYNSTVSNYPELLVCVPSGLFNTTNYSLDLTAEYSTDHHVQEFYYVDNQTLHVGNSSTNVSLMDLNLDDSTTFLFSFEDANGLIVPNAIVQVLRYYIGDGLFREVERSKEDDNGETHMHLLEEDVIYKFIITLENQVLLKNDQIL
ncbi:MAG: hypothetical protein KGD67_12365, partial [Candidatus Lokiarchaeota archaeon]|nr:hypothetical protein [Candidatus Lokiarchaeota archaeon]